MDNVTLTCVMGIDKNMFDLNLIKHFVEHYKSIGVEIFDIAVNAESESAAADGIAILKSLGIEPTIWIGSFSEFNKTDVLSKMQLNVKTDWTFVVDSDEFVQIDNLQSLIDNCIKTKKIVAKGILVDRISTSQVLTEVDANESIWRQYPVSVSISQSVGCNINKAFFFKTGNIISGNGNHEVYAIDKTGPFANQKRLLSSNFYYPTTYKIAHFKWTSTCYDRLIARISSFSQNVGHHWIKEIQAIVKNIKDGKINMEGFNTKLG